MQSITVCIPTKNRYDTLSLTLLSIAFQTVKPVEIILMDDSDNPVNLQTLSYYNYIFRLFYEFKIDFKCVFGQKKGQHYSHQFVQNNAKGELIFRIDDDEVAMPDTLEKLLQHMDKKTGAVAPLVLMPQSTPLPSHIKTNSIDRLHEPNVQWFYWKGVKEVEHLYSCFLYRKNIADYELSLSPVCHREETIFSHRIKRAGYKLIVNASALVYHFRQETGGIRSHRDMSMYEHDERIFQDILRGWNVEKNTDSKFIILDNGIGDHYAFKNILPDLKNRHKHITIACCFPEIFFDETGLELISIQQAKDMFKNIDEYNIYKKMIDWNWKQPLTDAFRKLYLDQAPQQTKKEEEKEIKNGYIQIN